MSVENPALLHHLVFILPEEERPSELVDEECIGFMKIAVVVVMVGVFQFYLLVEHPSSPFHHHPQEYI